MQVPSGHCRPYSSDPFLNDHQLFFHIDEWPLGFADLFLAQSLCHGVSDDTSHRNEWPGGRLNIFDWFAEFVLCKPSVTLIASSNQMRSLGATRARRASSAEISI